MSDTYRLQLRHGAEIQNFGTRDEVTSYIKGQLEYAKVSLLPYEPILFFYGEEDAKNAMIMVGLPEGQNHNGNSFFVVDTAELQEEIDNIGGQYDEVIEELKAEDEKLENAIKEEEGLRKAADEAEAEARSEKDAELEQSIVDEAETRANKDEELQESIDFTKDDLQSVINACGLIYNEKLSADRASYVPDLHDEIIRDSGSLSDAVDKISKFVTKLGQDLNFKVENTDTVNLSLESNEKDGGNILSADVNISGVDGLSKSTFDNNILGKTSDGLYAAASIVPSTKNPNILIFKTSGYVDGKFKVDAYETEVELTAYNGDTGKETGVNVSVDSNENKIYAELNLSSNKNNILKLEDGEYVVEGTSKNIKYKDTTVFEALKDHETHIEEIEDTIEFVKAVDVKPSETETVITTVDKSSKGDFVVGANVKLSSDKSIIVANGGLKADVSATFKKGTSTLTIYVGNNVYDIDLSDLAVSVLKSATYDASNEELVLEFIVGDTTKTVRIPVGTLIHDIEVDDTDTVDMTLKSVSGGPNHISAEVKVDKSHSDNILTVTSNGLYVSKAYITDAVSVETTERKEADKELKYKLDEVSALAQMNKENLAEEISRAKAAEQNNAKDIAQEIKDARAAEKANADAIAENKVAISENAKAIADETLRALNAEEANADAIVAEKERAIKAESDNANAIKSEVDRAVEKEADLLNRIGDNDVKIKENKDAIALEVSRATNAEQELNNKATELATNLANEVSRASAAEAKNANDISNEVSRATTAEGVLEGKVSKNTADIEANSNAIATESTRATSAEGKLTTDLTEEITRAQAADQANAQAVVAEKERAISAEGVLDGRVSQNESNITANTAAITSEATRAQGAEAILTTNLTDEITRAKAAEEANAKAVVVEKDRAEHIEADLLEKINKNASDIESISIEVGNIELKKESELSYALYVNGVKHGEFTIPKDQFLKSVNYNPTTKELVFVFNTTDGEVTTTISIADLVDVYTAGDGLSLNGNAFSVDFTTVSSVEAMQAAVNAEASRATAAEEANALAVVTEKGRAEGKETELLEKINTNTSNIAKNTSDIANEVSRAKDAEQANATAIMAEESRAKEAESENKNAIEKEISDARAAETAISEKVTKNESNIAAVKAVADKAASDLLLEAARAKAAESTITTNLENEVNRATAAEKLNSDAIDAENGRAQGEEKRLENSISINAGQIEVIRTSISDERLRAIEKEGELSLAIANETSRAQLKENELDGKVASEVERARQAETSLDTKISDQKNYTDSVKSELVDSIELVKDSISDTKAELTTSINNKANSSDVYTKSETTELFNGYAKTSEIQSKLNEKLNVTDAHYTYATKDSVQEIKSTYATLDGLNNVNTQLSNRIDSNEDSIDNINLTYNTATSELVYTDKKGLMHTYKLYSGSLIKKGEFDPKTNSIVLTIENGGIESQITIPVSELLSDLSDKIDANSSKIEALKDALNKLANKWTTTSSSTVELNKTTSGDVDTLTADVIIASSNKQAIVSTGGGLYVSNDLEDYTCVFGSEGTITAQNAISKLLETTTSIRNEFDNRITNNSNEIERLKTDVENHKSEIANIKSDVQTNKSEISTLKTQVNSNTVEIQTVKERFNTLDTKVGSLETRLVTAETTINNLNTNVTNLETELNTVKNSLSQQDGKITNLETTVQSLQTLVNSLINGSLKDLTDEIAKINNVTGYSTYSNTKNIPSRLDDLEGDTTDLYGEITTIKNDLIGTPDSTNDGSVWSELNNMVDADTY